MEFEESVNCGFAGICASSKKCLEASTVRQAIQNDIHKREIGELEGLIVRSKCQSNDAIQARNDATLYLSSKNL